MIIDEPTPVPGAPPRRDLEDLPTARTMRDLDAGEASDIRPPSTPAPGGLPPEVAAIASDPARQMNQYLLVAQVGAGGMGAVWKAWDTDASRWVAVKFLNAVDDDSIRRFRREAQVTQRLKHPNIATILDVAEGKGRTYLVMDFLEGGPIGSTGAPLRSLVETFVKVCRAIEFAHRNGVIHRDIKPANIMVSPAGEPFVTDFGLAKIVMPQSTISIAAAVMGTPSFMPPEQASGRIQAQDQTSDIYSLGATLYTIATGRPPFEEENATATLFTVCSRDPIAPRKLNAMIPRPLEAVILKAMDKDKRLRFTSAEEMALDLERFLAGDGVLARPPGAVRKLFRRVRANPLGAGGAVAFGLAVAVMVTVLLRPRPEAPAPVIINQPAPAVVTPGSEAEQAWREKFQPFQVELAYHNFSDLSPGRVLEAKSHIAAMPPSIAPWMAGWFLNQAVLLPADVWPKREWRERQSEAARRVRWCRAVLAVLEGTDEKFSEARRLASGGVARFAPVADWKGSITLTVTATPFAEIRSFRAGEAWIVRDGRRVVGGEVQYTPLVLEDVDISDFAIVLINPQIGERALSIPATLFQHGGRYVYAGSLDKPASFTLREVR